MKLKILVGIAVAGLIAAIVAWLAFPVSSFPLEWTRWINAGGPTWLQYTGDGSKLAYWSCAEPVHLVNAATGRGRMDEASSCGFR